LMNNFISYLFQAFKNSQSSCPVEGDILIKKNCPVEGDFIYVL
jgi:hypothetical protein